MLTVFTEYVQYVMQQLARYELIRDAQPYYGSVKGFQGVWAQGKTLQECERNLREVLEEWLLLKIRKKGLVPTLRKYDLNALFK